MKVYGPYFRKDGRAHVIHYDGATRRTESYPRYLMAISLNRPLEDWEHVDHIDGDVTNNKLENLQLLTQAENNRKSFLGTAEVGVFECPWCGKTFEKPMRSYRENQIKQGKAGPYCSRSCAGKAHH